MVLIAAVVWAAGLRDAPPTAAGVEVIRTGGEVRIHLIDLRSRPAEVEAAVRDAGLDVEVLGEPAAPSSVGRFLSITSDAAPLDTDALRGGTGTSYDSIVLPADWSGRLVVHLGRTARPGETWVGFGNAIWKDEPLACVDLASSTAAELAAVAAERGVAMRWQVWGNARPLRDADVTTGEAAGWRIARARSTSPSTVLVELQPPGSPPPHIDHDPRC